MTDLTNTKQLIQIGIVLVIFLLIFYLRKYKEFLQNYQDFRQKRDDILFRLKSITSYFPENYWISSKERDHNGRLISMLCADGSKASISRNNDGHIIQIEISRPR